MTPASLSDRTGDAARDALAMLRARHDGRHADVDAILDAAGHQGTRDIAATLLGITRALLVRVAAAGSVIEDEAMRAAALEMPIGQLLAEPEIREVAGGLITDMQRQQLGG